jgi:hypothetical protein
MLRVYLCEECNMQKLEPSLFTGRGKVLNTHYVTSTLYQIYGEVPQLVLCHINRTTHTATYLAALI